jgi:multidrug resistance protein, MATE family
VQSGLSGAVPPASYLPEIRRITALAWPVAMTHLQWIALNVIDTAMVGHAGTTELGYFSAGRMATWVALIIGMAALNGVLVFTARHIGAGEPEKTGAVYRQGMLFGLAMGAFFTALFLPFAHPILRFIGVPEELAGGGARVLQWQAAGYIPCLAMTAASLFMEGLGRPRVAMTVAFFTLPLNVVLNGLFVFGWLGAPVLGAAGAALGTTLTYAIGATILVAYIHRMPDRVLLGLDVARWRGAWTAGRELRRFGAAPGLASGLENGGFAVLLTLATVLGAVAASAFQVMISLHVVTVAAAVGFASAAGVRVGNAVGEGVREEIGRRGWLAAGLAVGSQLGFALLFAVAAPQLVAPFTDDPAVRALAIDMVRLLSLFLAFDGLQITMVFALRAAGDQVAAGVIQITGFFVITGGFGWILVERTALGPMGLAWGMCLGLAAAALLGAARFAWVTRR